MNRVIALVIGLATAPTAVFAQAAAPSVGATPPAVGTERVVRRPVKDTKGPRYRAGTPVLAHGINGVRINAVGEVLFDNP